MFITHEQAIEMYARFCRARYGANASETVRATATRLAKTGDLEGEKVWNAVGVKLNQLNAATSQRPSLQNCH